MEKWNFIIVFTKVFSMLLLLGFGVGFLYSAIIVVSEKVKTGEFDLKDKGDKWVVKFLALIVVLVIVLAAIAFYTLWRL